MTVQEKNWETKGPRLHSLNASGSVVSSPYSSPLDLVSTYLLAPYIQRTPSVFITETLHYRA